MQKKPTPPQQEKGKPRQSLNSYLRYSNVAFQLFAAILLGVWGGMRLDAWWGTDPWLTVLLSLLGVAAGLYTVLKEFIRKDP
jgi:F0F1-type ATP synthase assembly protein I